MNVSLEKAESLLARLRGEGFERLAACTDSTLQEAWSDTVSSLLDPGSHERRQLEEVLSGHVALTPPALAAALELMLSGADSAVAARVFSLAEPRRVASPALVVLAQTPLGLAVQSLLPALARRRPLVLKSARTEPRFTPFFLASLAAREPSIGAGYVATTWEGGIDPIEQTFARGVDRIIVFGGAESVSSLEHRWGDKVVAYGPKLSVALIGGDAETDPAALHGLARDVALFEQQGCLSLQLVLTECPGETLSRRLAEELQVMAQELPPPPLSTARALAIHQLRSEAEMRGHWVSPSPIDRGTVIFGGHLDEAPVSLERALPLRPSPGGRTVLVWQVPTIEQGIAALEPLRGRLQGAVWAPGATAPGAIAESLRELGVSRVAAPGELQHVDALWPNGGIDPLDLY